MTAAIELTLIGHACWIAKTPDVSIIFDPLLFDPNQADCYEVHPTRGLDRLMLPQVDVIVVSHRHIDHFDIRSLAILPRSAEILCPDDPLVIEAVRELGFKKVS